MRLAISESAYKGQKTTLTTEHINLLKNLAFSTGKDWFSNLNGYVTGKNMDTEKYEITSICDGDYCAIFKVQLTDECYLIDYTFEKSKEKGYEIEITED